MHEASPETTAAVATPTGERVLHGIAVSPGIVIAPVFAYARPQLEVAAHEVAEEEREAEIERFEAAVQRAERDLEKIAALAREKVGDDSASVFEAHALMLRDASLYEAVVEKIREGSNAEASVHEVLNRHRQLLRASNSEYIRERASDLLDLEQRLLVHLRRGKLRSSVDEGSIITSVDLTAADVVIFSRRGIQGVAMTYGGPTSHVSIMARALSLPAVVGIKNLHEEANHGDLMILDGVRGAVILRPEPETLRFYRQRKERHDRLVREQLKVVPLPPITRDGHRVTLRANLEFEEELDLLKTYGAEGIGLFRTEILVLMRRRLQVTEAEQYRIYRSIVERVESGGVTFRVLDLGGDKMLPLGHREQNPFLGWRGVRVLMDKPDLLVPQLRAILRAAHHGESRLLIPMVTTVEEVVRFREMLTVACDTLEAEGVPHERDIKIGIMVEVPAVALLAEQFAPHVDFFSIGTNDLTQYTLAVDRGNDLVGHLYDELHPAVLHLIARTIEVGHRHGLQVSLCGELAGNPLATPILLGLGLDEFSLSPVYLPEVKQIIRRVRMDEARELARACLEAPTAEHVRCLVENWLEARHCPLSITLDEPLLPNTTS